MTETMNTEKIKLQHGIQSKSLPRTVVLSLPCARSHHSALTCANMSILLRNLKLSELCNPSVSGILISRSIKLSGQACYLMYTPMLQIPQWIENRSNSMKKLAKDLRTEPLTCLSPEVTCKFLCVVVFLVVFNYKCKPRKCCSKIEQRLHFEWWNFDL